MKIATICAGLLALACVLPVHAAEVRAKVFQVGANVDAQGKVTATQFDAAVPAGIANVLTAAMKQWRFVPARLNGQAVAAHTFVRVRLKATPDAQGQYALRISFVSNGPRLDREVGPRYPADAIRSRETATLLLEATVQADGHLSDLNVSGKSSSPRTMREFKKNVLEAARQWRYTPETVDGQAVATRMRIPFHFELNSWPPSKTPAPAAADDDDAQPGDPLTHDQDVALDSPLQPQSVATIVSGS